MNPVETLLGPLLLHAVVTAIAYVNGGWRAAVVVWVGLLALAFVVRASALAWPIRSTGSPEDTAGS